MQENEKRNRKEFWFFWHDLRLICILSIRVSPGQVIISGTLINKTDKTATHPHANTQTLRKKKRMKRGKKKSEKTFLLSFSFSLLLLLLLLLFSWNSKWLLAASSLSLSLSLCHLIYCVCLFFFPALSRRQGFLLLLWHLLLLGTTFTCTTLSLLVHLDATLSCVFSFLSYFVFRYLAKRVDPWKRKAKTFF